MIPKTLLLPAVLSVAAVLLSCSQARKPRRTGRGPAADLVVRNARIFTVDKGSPWAEALAVAGERIIAVSSNEAVGRYIDPRKTQVLDAKGRLVVPGFNDAHIHLRGSEFTQLNFRYVADIKKIQQMVAEKVRSSKPGAVIRGRGWDHENFPGKRWPTREILDEVAPNNPVILTRVDGHSSWVNSLALRQSGITKETESPPDGEVVKDPATGEPTGILKEAARDLLHVEEPARTPEEVREQAEYEMQLAVEHATKAGVTSIQHLYLQQDIFQGLLDKGKLTLRVTFNGRLPEKEEDLRQYEELRRQYPQNNDRLRFGYLKGFIDGTLGSETAMLFEPYADDPTKVGLAQMPYEELERRVLFADKAGFQIGIHAIGPKGNRWVLDAYEKARLVNGIRDSRHRIEHAQILAAADIPRFAGLGVIASMQPTHCISDKRFAEKRLGLARCAEGAYVWRKLLDAGARIAFGTDFNVEPLDPLEGLYAATTRKDRNGEEGPGWFPGQILSMEKAIELYTAGSAYAEFTENRKGMLKTGYLADFVIFKEDLFTMPKESIMKNQVDYTVLGGKIVYRREGMPSSAEFIK